MKSISNKIRVSYDESGQVELTFTLLGKIKELQKGIDGLRGIVEKKKLLSLDVSQYRKQRSPDANSYMWVICQKIAEVIHSTKELVYQKFVKDVGQFSIVPIKDGEPLKRWIEVWESKGLGWFSEVLDDSKLDGYKKVVSYWGSSSYNTWEMTVLIDEIILQAKELGIEVIPPEKLTRMKNEWKKNEVEKVNIDD